MNLSSSIMVNLLSRLVECPSEKEIIVPLLAILATKWPQQQKWENDHFDQAPAMRVPHVQAPASWAASKEIEASMRHGAGYGPRMLTCLYLRVNPHEEIWPDDFPLRWNQGLPR
jgi:hypothetical protein